MAFWGYPMDRRLYGPQLRETAEEVFDDLDKSQGIDPANKKQKFKSSLKRFLIIIIVIAVAVGGLLLFRMYYRSGRDYTEYYTRYYGTE